MDEEGGFLGGGVSSGVGFLLGGGRLFKGGFFRVGLLLGGGV